MLCVYCRGFDLRSIAKRAILNSDTPQSSSNDTSCLFKYHVTMLGVHSAIAAGCKLCSLFMEKWLENSLEWAWGDIWWSDIEESDQQTQRSNFVSAISKNPELFRPITSLQLHSVWKSEAETDGRLFQRAVVGVSFGVEGNTEFPAPDYGKEVTLGICAKSGNPPGNNCCF